VVHALANEVWNRLVAISLIVVVPGTTITVEVDEPSTTYFLVRSANGKNGVELNRAHALPAMARRAITRTLGSVLLAMMLLMCMLTLLSCRWRAPDSATALGQPDPTSGDADLVEIICDDGYWCKREETATSQGVNTRIGEKPDTKMLTFVQSLIRKIAV
jgi:hypothetical protein